MTDTPSSTHDTGEPSTDVNGSGKPITQAIANSEETAPIPVMSTYLELDGMSGNRHRHGFKTRKSMSAVTIRIRAKNRRE